MATDTPDAPPPPSSDPRGDDRRFVRDPYARFGGVGSGIAHYFGWDVALTRLGVVLLFIVSGGTAILAYLAAWVIIPRATYWPPSGGARPAARTSSRDVGIGLAILGALLALAIAGGRPGAVLIPLALIGGGIWLLSRDPATAASPPPAPTLSMTPGSPMPGAGLSEAAPVAAVAQDAIEGPPTPPAPPSPPPPPFDPGPPVPPRSRGRKWTARLLIGFAFLLLLLMVAVPTGLYFVARTGNLDIDPDTRVVITPESIGELPAFIAEDEAEVILDLTDLEPSDFAGEDTPVDVEIDVDAGEIRVRVPDDLRVSVDASVAVGNVEVFGADSGGFFSERLVDADDPHVDLKLDAIFGQVTVERE